MRQGILHRLRVVMGLLCLFALWDCVGSQAKMKKVESPTEKELRSEWRNFYTYCLKDGYSISTLGSAILFQVKNNKTIQKSVDWQEVNNDKMASDCASFLKNPSPVMNLIGQNDENFGYLIFEFKDGVSAVIIDAETIGLSYHATPKTGGP
jgi:hypothetical protein